MIVTLIFDPEHWTFRGGDDMRQYGDLYTRSAQGQVQRDRTFYLYNVVGTLPIAEVIDLIERLRALAPVYCWKEIQWERRRKDGTVHVAKIPIVGRLKS